MTVRFTHIAIIRAVAPDARKSTGVYLSMGWLVVVAVDPLFVGVPVAGLLRLLAGGLFYTVGVAF